MNLFVFLSWSSVAFAMLMKMQMAEPYNTICTSQVGYFYAFGNSTCAPLRYTKRITCECPDTRFIQTVLSCINKFMHNVSVEEREMQQTMAINALLKSCKQYNKTSIAELNKTSLHLEPYGNEKGVPGTWPVTTAFEPSDEELILAKKAFYTNMRAEPLNKKYGASLVGYWAAILLLRGLKNWGTNLFPLWGQSLNRYRLIRKCRSDLEFKVWNSYGVSLLNFLIVSGFLVLVVVFTFADLPLAYPNYNWLNSSSATYATNLGMRSGVIGLYILPLLVLFAGRNNFLLWLTGWSQESFLLYHKWVSRSEVWLMVVHTIAYSIARASVGRYPSMWKNAYWNWGVVSVAFACLLAVQSLAVLRRLAYDVFVIVHIIAVILFLVGGYYHLALLSEPIGLYFFYASFAVWGLDRFVRLVRVLYAGFDAESSPQLGNNATVELHHNMLVITVKKPKAWNLTINPGSHVYIHFLQYSKFWKSHPFTMVSSTEEPNKIKLFCKVHKGITKAIADEVLETARLDEKASEIPQKEFRILLDGPYGHSHNLFEYDELVFVAGGSGITSPFSYIQSNLYKFPHGYQKIKLFWAVRDASLYKWFENELRFLKEYSYVEVHLFVSEGYQNSRKLNIDEVIGSEIRNATGPMSILCCGPGSMNNAVKHAVSKNLELTTQYVQFYEESFIM